MFVHAGRHQRDLRSVSAHGEVRLGGEAGRPAVPRRKISRSVVNEPLTPMYTKSIVTAHSTEGVCMVGLVLGAVDLTGWYVGYIIAGVLITVVVILVAIILGLARRIGVQADIVVGALDQARINTLPLWDVDKVNGGVRSIIQSAQEARAALGGE